MSEKKEKEHPNPPWWVQIVFAGFVTWFFTNLAYVLALLGTGVVTLGQIGIVRLLVVVLVPAVFSGIGFILGIRYCVTLAYALIAGLFKYLSSHVKVAWEPGEQEQVRNSFEEYLHSQPQTPSPTPTSWQKIQYRLSDGFSNVVLWLIVPRRFRK